MPAQGGELVTTFSMQTTEAYHAGVQENAQLHSLGIMATWLPFILFGTVPSATGPAQGL